MKNSAEFYDAYVRQSAPLEEDRLRRLVRRMPRRVDALLDIGCGMGRNLRVFAGHVGPGTRMCGIDVAPSVPSALAEHGFEGKCGDASLGIDYPDETFDVVVAGEVIEHVIDTDRLLEESRRVLKPGGVLLLTTPNLAYLPNRVLLGLGIQPIFTETSLRRNMGRHFAFLGQNGSTQGHLKIFTVAAARELVDACGLTVTGIEGYRYFQTGVAAIVDGIFSWRASFAAGFIIEARKP
jgi:SAM-dependent methyltransferase